MIKFFLSCALLVASPSVVGAQGQSSYNELPNPNVADGKLWEKVGKARAGWGSTDVRYKKEVPPGSSDVSGKVGLTAWKGECVSAQAVVWTPGELADVAFEPGALVSSKGAVIGADNVRMGFVRHVMSDEIIKDGQGICGPRVAAEYDSMLVADLVDRVSGSVTLPARSTMGCWMSVSVPRDAAAGTYKGWVTVRAGSKTLARLDVTLNVRNRTLPAPADWAFHLDLWQNPYSVARYHGVTPFSKEHFEFMKPVMKMYADAGGKVITVPITYRPWNGQTYDGFDSMVTWMKRADGTWAFDFTPFDMWVQFMMDLGVKKQINCYSMVPWRLSFRYIDQATETMKYIEAKPGDVEFEALWTTMLKEFAAHLRAKRWFDITHIAMDERSLDDMLKTVAVVKKADKDFKVSLAGTYHKELVPMLDDYCTALEHVFPKDEIAKRRSQGKVTTYYTCCAEAKPNTFVASPPAEAEWLGWYAAAKDFDGYLRWAFNSWVEKPMLDARFRAWPAGDPFIVYPEGNTSVRFERLVSGIQAYEKVRLLKKEAQAKGDKRMLDRINSALSVFEVSRLDAVPAAEMVAGARRVINSL